MKNDSSTAAPTATLVLRQPDPPPRRKYFLGTIAVLCVASVCLYWLQMVYFAQPRKQAAADKAAGKAPVAPAVKQPVVQQSQVSAVPIRAAAIKSPVRHEPAATTEEAKRWQTAQIAFNKVVAQASQFPSTYGFESADTLTSARLGKEIPVYTISERERADYKSGQPVKPLLQPADCWVFPVLIGNQIRCMIQVSRDRHDYVPGSGSKMLAISWNKILEKWPAAKGYHPQLIVNPEIPGYYFTVPELRPENVTDVNQMIFSNGDLSPAAVILASWG